ncbi:helix-turn-helix domain-containing protein [Rosistilla oblonga]|uniref:HTH-type transcriptional repressor RghR n=1 Tax=Rosistilla oblonga TaxID=2527990 RepID=A0A518ITK8_9BACT|nr:helix-turn-helix transcriptional regulator [Rosistilla oblonga]QDV56400.1 HTH-type transcriptional repressor RghR [Rosistilla oblonga]
MILDKKEEGSSKFTPVDMALAVLVEKIQSLPRQDRADLFEVSKAFFSEDAEDRASAARAMTEILEQAETATSKLEFVEAPGDELVKWIEYVSKQIRTERKQAGLTQEELARKSGIPQSHISRLENGEHSPSFLTLEKLADAMKIPVSRLDPSA